MYGVSIKSNSSQIAKKNSKIKKKLFHFFKRSILKFQSHPTTNKNKKQKYKLNLNYKVGTFHKWSPDKSPLKPRVIG